MSTASRRRKARTKSRSRVIHERIRGRYETALGPAPIPPAGIRPPPDIELERETLINLAALATVPRYKRFYTALAISLKYINADDMDKLEPILEMAVARHVLHEMTPI